MAKIITLKAFIISTLRRASYRWPARNNAQKRARISRGIYKCELCGNEMKAKDTVKDHIHPVVDVTKGFTTWDDYINRMFCDESGFQVICSTCHTKKSDNERELRKLYRKKK